MHVFFSYHFLFFFSKSVAYGDSLMVALFENLNFHFFTSGERSHTIGNIKQSFSSNEKLTQVSRKIHMNLIQRPLFKVGSLFSNSHLPLFQRNVRIGVLKEPQLERDIKL